MTPAPSRISNYFFARDRSGEDLPWVRVGDLAAKLPLKTPVVLVAGVFDILHSGHMKTLFTARRHAKTLVVAVDSDERAASTSGRPVQTVIERMTALSFMPVDYLVEIEKPIDLVNLVHVTCPSLIVQGAEVDSVPFPSIPRCLVRPTGMRTTEIIRRILCQHS